MRARGPWPSIIALSLLGACAERDPYRQYCEQQVGCDCREPRYESVDACAAGVKEAIRTEKELAEEAGLVYDQECAERNLAHEAGWACRYYDEFTVDDNLCPPCAIVYGENPYGSSCYSYGYLRSDCAADLECNGLFGTCVKPWRCHRLAVGDVCVETVEGPESFFHQRLGTCPAGSFCAVSTSGRCETLLELEPGEPCTHPGHCISGYCDGVCRELPEPPVGAACPTQDDPNTPENEAGDPCEGLLCLDGACVAPFAEGERCVGESFYGFCAEGLECDEYTETCLPAQPALCYEFEPEGAEAVTLSWPVGQANVGEVAGDAPAPDRARGGVRPRL